jgi:HSP20 family protein
MMRNLLSSFVELVHLQSEMNKVFEALQDLHEAGAGQEVGFAPPYDIMETPEGIVVMVDLPGVCPETLKVRVQGGSVTMQGERERSVASSIVAYHLMERDRGPFLRRLRVEGAVNMHKGDATYERGVLTLRCPRGSEQRGRSVDLPLTVNR